MSEKKDMFETKTRWERSCGAVVFTRDGGEVRYVIVENPAGRGHGFPKGHVENGETDHETAKREIAEETALDVRFVGDFRREVTYPVGIGVMKKVVYFLAEYSGQSPRARHGEIASVTVLPFDGALAKLEREDARRILCAADEYVRSLAGD